MKKKLKKKLKIKLLKEIRKIIRKGESPFFCDALIDVSCYSEYGEVINWYPNLRDLLEKLGLTKACIKSGGSTDKFAWTHPDYANPITNYEERDDYIGWKLDLIEMALEKLK